MPRRPWVRRLGLGSVAAILFAAALGLSWTGWVNSGGKARMDRDDAVAAALDRAPPH